MPASARFAPALAQNFELALLGIYVLLALAFRSYSRPLPILLTTLTTFLGISPLVLETSLQARFLIPTAVALGFGVLAGSALVLVAVPAYATLSARLALWARRQIDAAEPSGGR